jgi:hypothetical protein
MYNFKHHILLKILHIDISGISAKICRHIYIQILELNLCKRTFFCNYYKMTFGAQQYISGGAGNFDSGIFDSGTFDSGTFDSKRNFRQCQNFRQ